MWIFLRIRYGTNVTKVTPLKLSGRMSHTAAAAEQVKPVESRVGLSRTTLLICCLMEAKDRLCCMEQTRGLTLQHARRSKGGFRWLCTPQRKRRRSAEGGMPEPWYCGSRRCLTILSASRMSANRLRQLEKVEKSQWCVLARELRSTPS